MPTIADTLVSGNPYIDGFLGSKRWADAVVSFSFPTGPGDYLTPDSANWDQGAVEFSDALKLAARTAAAEVNDYVKAITLQEVLGNVEDATIKMAGTTSYGGVGGFSRGVGTADNQGEVWMGQGWLDGRGSEVYGDLSWVVTFHELGHSLGLSHTDEGSGVNGSIVPIDRDSGEFTVMSYKGYTQPNPQNNPFSNARNEYAQSYMMLDIQALQYMYGADFDTRSGDTTYSFSASTGEMFIDGVGQGTPEDNILFRTIWDGNGTDTYDFSLYGANRDLILDLAPGGWSDMDRDSNFQAANLNRNAGTNGPEIYARGSVFNALLYQGDERSLIENAVGGAGDDSIRGNQADNALAGGKGDDSLRGLAGNDTLTQGSGGGILDGGDDNDWIYAGSGADAIFGGTGSDRVFYSGSNAGVAVNLATGAGSGGWAQGDSIFGIEHVTGSEAGDTITGNSQVNSLLGKGGNDLLNGAGEDDIISGEAGNDTLIGGAGGDFLFGGDGIDTVRYGSAITLNLTTGIHTGEAAGDGFNLVERFEGSNADDVMIGDGTANVFNGRDGDDDLRGMGGDDILTGGRGLDTIDGGNGTDWVDYSLAGAGGVQVNLGANIAIGPGIDGDALFNIENVAGSSGDDQIRGDAGANVILGNNGDDSLIGEGGADSLYGGRGDDTVIGGAGMLVDGGKGEDVLKFFGAAVQIDLGSGLHGGGAAGSTILGFERIEGTAAGDVLASGNKQVAFEGRDGDDGLFGGNGRQSLHGGAGDDSIQAGAGDDFLGGGTGDDVLSPGTGIDLILYALGDGHDTVIGYSATDDLIRLDAASFGASVSDPLADWLALGAAPNANHGWLLIIGNTLAWDADGAGPAAGPVTLMTFLRGAAPTDTGDFIWV